MPFRLSPENETAFKVQSSLIFTVIAILVAVVAMFPSVVSRFLRPLTSGLGMGVAPLGSGVSLPERVEKVTVAAGCFWGVEHLYRKNFEGKGLLDARVGYCGGDTNNPSYRVVCSGSTGHAESLQVLYDPSKVSYEAMLEFFFRMHDPTTENRQGGDVGTQYRSAIFFHSPEQETAAKKLMEKVQNQWYTGKKIVTQLVPAGQWWDAEDYHQLYLQNTPGGYECPAHYVRSFPPLS
ncbi:Peptide methionine sulfoxide reductase [Rhizina undulata]